MPGERKHITSQSDKYGTLDMRPYVVFGNDINAFYDKRDNLIFVLDNTINQRKPNVLLVMNSDGDRKWDEILSDDYMVDLETIRPKQDNKYQKLDIEYSGLAVYENLINAYDAGEDLSEYLTQLDILRDSASKHSAMARLNAANEIIAKTNNTIAKTKESIIDLQSRLKTLRAKLSGLKKEIGKVPTKQSASKILKVESQIDATNEKLKRAKKRLESAQRRLDAAINDAEIASAFLNQSAPEIKRVAPKSKSVVVAPKYEMQTTPDDEDDLPAVVEETEEKPEDVSADNESDTNDSVEPLFDSDPEILDENIAFKPIAFNEPVTPIAPMQPEQPENVSENENSEQIVFAPVSENVFNQDVVVAPEPEYESFDSAPVLNAGALLGTKTEEDNSVLNSMRPIEESDQKPVLESMTPVESEEIVEQQPINITSATEIDTITPNNVVPVQPEVPVVQPVINTFNAPVEPVEEHSKSTFMYYLLLIVLIVLSVFTLWLYQKHTNVSTPMLTPKTVETASVEEEKQPELKKAEPVQAALPDVVEETVFLDEIEEEKPESVVDEEMPEEEAEEESDVVEDEEFVESEEPEEYFEEPQYEEEPQEEEESEYVEPVVNKPEYGAGQKYDKMFVMEDERLNDDSEFIDDEFSDEYYDEDYDAEEAAYQSDPSAMWN